MSDGILSTVGRTPLVRLRRFLTRPEIELFAKLELLNPGGSIKDRTALAILEEALRAGAVQPGSVVVESSSGNMGIGLAQACRFHGLRFICVVDPKTTRQHVQILKAYGAEVDTVLQPDPATGEWLQARLARVQTLLRTTPGAFWPNQYSNPMNPAVHARETMREIAEALDGRVDLLFVATSTCGTIRGCADCIRELKLGTRLVAVDAMGSRIFSDLPAPRSIPGIGAGFRPSFCDDLGTVEVVHVSDLDCVDGCRKLVRTEAILAGGSSGGVLTAVERVASTLPAGSRCVAILPDRGERYLETVYCDDWVERTCARPASL